MLMKVYASTDFLPPGVHPVEMIYPWWGVPSDENESFERSGLREYAAEAKAIFEITYSSLTEADIALLPFDWRHTLSNPDARALAERLAEQASRARVPLLVFFFHDSDEAVDLEQVVVCRPSITSPSRRGEIAMPAWGDDFVGRLLGGTVPCRPKLTQPRVGFCGFAGYSLLPSASLGRKARSLVRHARRGFPSKTVREKAISVLAKDPRIATDFVLREHFYAGVSDQPLVVREPVHDAFRNNLINNDYALTGRGGGNFSYRFYEALSAGRPPVLLDTRCALPFEDKIPYEELILRVPEDRLQILPDALVADHESRSDAEFVERQIECRRAWQKWLSPLGFFKNLVPVLQDMSS